MVTTTTAARAMQPAPIRAKTAHMRDNHPRDRVARSDSRKRLRFGLAFALVK